MSDRKKVVVLGAGVTGLAAAYRLSQSKQFDVHIVDKETQVGGVCRSFTEGDFILDYGPHKFYTLLDGILDELKGLMGEDLLEREKTQTIYLKGRYFNFPLKMSEMLLRFSPVNSAQLLLSFGWQTVKNSLRRKEARTYEDFIIERFGPRLYRQIFEPMARKVYGDPKELDRKLAEVRVSSPGLFAILKQVLLQRQADKTVSAATFHYPKLGYGMIPERLKEKSSHNGAQFHLGSRILNIEIQAGKVSAVMLENSVGERTRLSCDHLVYTVPLSILPDLIDKEIPTDIRRICRFVAYRHTVIHYYLLKGEPVLPSMWVFFPESQFRFGRLSEMVKFSPYTAPKGHTALMVDFTCSGDDPYWLMDDEELGEKLFQQLHQLKLFPRERILKQFSKRFQNLYPIYSVGYQENLGAIRRLETLFQNLFFIGRLGDFNYNNADQCLDMGFRAAEHILNESATQSWQNLRADRFAQYKIVD
jgi:protoporphyrinogen oxidase